MSELASADLQPALVAPTVAAGVTTQPHNADIELVTRRTATHLYGFHDWFAPHDAHVYRFVL